MSARHLVSRFFGSVSAKRLNEEELEWVRSQLLPGEMELWVLFSVADQRHTYEVAQKAVRLLGGRPPRPVVAAALLHDIGKIEADVGTFGRTLATLAGRMATDTQKEAWATESGWLGRAGRYLKHNEIGAEMLEGAGSDPLTITWAREHEYVHTRWTLPVYITDALWKADQ